MKQYAAKGNMRPFSKNGTAIRMIKLPLTNAAKNPTKQEDDETAIVVSCEISNFKSSRQLPPIIVGMESRKENRIARLASHPKIRAQLIVEALREIPGISANA